LLSSRTSPSSFTNGFRLAIPVFLPKQLTMRSQPRQSQQSLIGFSINQ
jgi:hypothetical protein